MPIQFRNSKVIIWQKCSEVFPMYFDKANATGSLLLHFKIYLDMASATGSLLLHFEIYLDKPNATGSLL